MVVDHDEAREALVLRTETVGHPAADAGVAHQDRAGIPFVMGEHMIVRPAVARMNERQIVHHRPDVREQFRYELPGLAVALELERALHQRTGETLPDADPSLARQRLAVVLLEHRLVVERVDVTHAAAHEQGDYRLGLRAEMRVAGRGRRLDALRVARVLGRQQTVLLQHVRQGDPADSLACPEQEVPAGHEALLSRHRGTR